MADTGQGGTARGCPTTIRGVVSAPGSLAAAGLPSGFYRVPQGQQAATVPDTVYQLRQAGPDAPRIGLGWSNSPGPLSRPVKARVGGADVTTTVRGHDANGCAA
jgi:hypothetical protein